MDDLKLKDDEVKATEIINLQLKHIIESNDTESLKSIGEEFDIPDITVLPSLDDILTQDDPINLLDSDIREDIDNVLLIDDDIMSVISSNSFSSSGKFSGKKTPEIKTKKKLYGEVIACTHISLLGNICNRNEKATALTAAERLICIGFSSGKIFILSLEGDVKGEVNTSKVDTSDGMVTSLDIKSGLLVASYSNGTVHIWDITKNSHLQKIENTVPDSTIIQTLIIEKDRILYLVSQGSLFDIRLTSTLSIRGSEVTCLFSGSHGEVLNVKRLDVAKSHQLYPYNIVALCSFKQVMVLSLKPAPSIKYSLKLWGDTTSLPIVNWYYHPEDCPIPKLVVGRDKRFITYGLNINSRDQIFLRKIKSCSVEFHLISVLWINTNTIAALDTNERLHLIDVHSLSRLQTVSRISDIALCYNTSFYRSTITGGNVSKAMHVASKYATYNSIASYPGGLWFLGNQDIMKIVSTPWRQRIIALKDDMMFGDAINLTLAYYEGKGKGVSSLVFNKMGLVQRYCDEIIVGIIHNYIDETQQDLNELRKALKDCINATITIKKPNYVYDEVYIRLSQMAPIQKVFYEVLEPFIFNNKISSLNPVLMKGLLEYFKTNNKLQSFEKCILHLDPLNLDIHNTLILCEQYDLYEALLFIYNACLLDFVTPLNKLLQILEDQILFNDTSKSQVGYVILMYISNCLVGNIPSNNMQYDDVLRTQNVVFNCVFCKHSERNSPHEPDYPYVKLMLQLDTREFLNVMSVSFSHLQCLPIHQIVIDILLYIMIEENNNYTPLQIGHLFTFLARQKAVTEFYLDRKYVDQALDCLATNDVTGHEEREQALLELILTIGIDEFDEERLLHLSETAEFYQVCEVIYDKRKEYDKVLYCYWMDTSRLDKVFNFIYHIMEGQFSDVDKTKIRETCVNNIDKLVAINNDESATLILKVFREDLEKIVLLLDDNPRALYALLQCVFDISKIADEAETINSEIHHVYIKLMSRYNPEFVCSYLKVADGYTTDYVLELCLIANLKDAAAYLYEKRGDLEDAFKLYYDALSDVVSSKEMVFVEETLKKVVNFCQRNSHKLSLNDKESYWFSLIDLLLGFGDSAECIALQELLVDNMLGFVSSSKVLDRLIKSSSNKMFKTYGDIKRVIGNMLDTLMYEDILLNSTQRIVQNDIFTSLRKDRYEFLKGSYISNNKCVVCLEPIISGEETFFIFPCSHLAHTHCVEHMRFKYCMMCELDHKKGNSAVKQAFKSTISIEEPYRRTQFDVWRDDVNVLRKVLVGEDRLTLIHEVCEDEIHDDNVDDDYYAINLDDLGGYEPGRYSDDSDRRPTPSPKHSQLTPPSRSSAATLTPFQQDSNFLNKSPITRRAIVSKHRHDVKSQQANPFDSEDEEDCNNPFQDEASNPFADEPGSGKNPFDEDLNPFASGYNPFGDDI